MLVPNPAARLETFMFDNVPVDRIGLKVIISKSWSLLLLSKFASDFLRQTLWGPL